MKQPAFLAFTFLLSLLIACKGPSKPNGVAMNVQGAKTPKFKEGSTVSLIQLLSNPEKYDGKHVQVIGYLNLEFEGDALYLHKEDYLASISNNAIWVSLSRDSAMKNEKHNKKYVIVGGIFDAGHTGHMGMFGGSLKDITRLDLWYQPNEKK